MFTKNKIVHLKCNMCINEIHGRESPVETFFSRYMFL